MHNIMHVKASAQSYWCTGWI